MTEEGLRIFTSFDPILQMKAETSMSETFKRLAGRKGADEVESAMVVTNPETGEVQALIGSRQPASPASTAPSMPCGRSARWSSRRCT